MQTIILVLLFLVAAAVVWIAGVWLARTTAVIDQRLHIGQEMGGLIILAVVTNLPEIAITVSAILHHNLDIAVGNILGGIAIQTVVLVILDFAARKSRQPLSTLASSVKLRLETLLLIVLIAILLAGSQLPSALHIGPLGVADIVIVIVWFVGVQLISRREKHQQSAASTAKHEQKQHDSKISSLSSRRIWLIFIVSALATLIAGVVLEVTGDMLANSWGLGGIVFGATILAATTSLPEISTGITAIKMKNYQLAMSDIIGGNAFLILLLVPVGALAGTTLITHITSSEVFLVAVGLVLTIIYMAGFLLRRQRRTMKLGIDSWLVLGSYVLAIAILAIFA